RVALLPARERRLQQRFAIGEVPIEAPLRDAQRARERLHVYRCETARAERLERSILPVFGAEMLSRLGRFPAHSSIPPRIDEGPPWPNIRGRMEAVMNNRRTHGGGPTTTTLRTSVRSHSREFRASPAEVGQWIEACWSGTESDPFPRDVIRTW